MVKINPTYFLKPTKIRDPTLRQPETIYDREKRSVFDELFGTFKKQTNINLTNVQTEKAFIGSWRDSSVG